MNKITWLNGNEKINLTLREYVFQSVAGGYVGTKKDLAEVYEALKKPFNADLTKEEMLQELMTSIEDDEQFLELFDWVGVYYGTYWNLTENPRIRFFLRPIGKDVFHRRYSLKEYAHLNLEMLNNLKTRKEWIKEKKALNENLLNVFTPPSWKGRMLFSELDVHEATEYEIAEFMVWEVKNAKENAIKRLARKKEKELLEKHLLNIPKECRTCEYRETYSRNEYSKTSVCKKFYCRACSSSVKRCKKEN